MRKNKRNFKNSEIFRTNDQMAQNSRNVEGEKLGKNAFAIGLQAPFFMYGILDEIEKKRGKEPVFSAKYRRSTPS